MSTVHKISWLFSVIIIFVFALVLLPVNVFAEDATILRTVDTPNPQASALFGLATSTGDLDGDGKAEVLIGTPAEDIGANENQGRVYVYSGDTGSLLYTFDTPNPQSGSSFGSGLATGDVDGDNKVDVAVSATGEDIGTNQNQSRVYVFSGATGNLILTLDSPNPQQFSDFGNSLSVGDVNGDGKADIVVAQRHVQIGAESDAGRVYVFSGQNDGLLYSVQSPNPQADSLFGDYVTSGDVDGDQKADLLVSAFFEDVNGEIDQGRVYLFSGASGSLVRTLDLPEDLPGEDISGPFFGFRTAIGNIDNDSIADIAVTSHFADVNGSTDQGRVYLFSGSSGSLLRTLDTPTSITNAQFGSSISIGDVLGDSKTEIVVGARLRNDNIQGVGRVYVFDGSNGNLVTQINNPNPQANSGFGDSDTTSVNNIDSIGKKDILVSAPFANVSGNNAQGKAYVFTFPNTPPTVDAGGPYNVNEGDSVQVSATGNDPENGELTYVWDLDNNGSFETSGQTATFSASNLDGGSYTISVKATDSGNLTTTDSTTVIVNSLPLINSFPGYPLDEGDAYSYPGFFSDGDSNSWTATVNYGDGSGTQSLTLTDTNFSLSHTYKDNGSFVITVNVTDNQGATGTKTATVIVSNVAPAVGAITITPVPAHVNIPITVSASFTDDGVLDTHTASWNWGDGTTTGTVTESNGSGSVSNSHTYTNYGTYTITLTVTDKDNGSTSKSTSVTVVKQLTDLVPAKIWVSKNTLDIGVKFDLIAGVYRDDTLVSSGRQNSVSVGSGGFNNATLVTIPFDSFSATDFPSGSDLKVKVGVRNACNGSLLNSGTATLWFNDSQANSNFGAELGDVRDRYYLRNGFLLTTTVGTGPRQNIDVAAGAKCSAFKPFGTWSITP